MASLRALVESPALSSSLVYLVEPETDPEVEDVALIEAVNDLENIAEHAIVLLTRGASATATGYRLDVALRMARSVSAAALVVSGTDRDAMSPASSRIADRWGIAILGTSTQVDLAKLAIAIGRELSGGTDVALMRAHAATRAVAAAPTSSPPEEFVRRAGAALGVPLVLTRDEPADGPRAVVTMDDHVEGWIVAPRQEGDLGLGLDIGLHVAAAATREALARARRAEEAPIQSRAEVLSELLTSSAHTRSQLVRQARNLGILVDGWHIVARLEFENLAGARAADELSTRETRTSVARTLLRALRASGGVWHTARTSSALFFIRISADDPGLTGPGEVVRAMDHALAGVRARVPATLLRCGVGSPHPGASGLVSSASEAKAALTVARTSGRVNVPVPFDSVGLRRTLLEWYASETAREAVSTVLAPLEELGSPQAERLIQTLHVYLDTRRSLVRTAETLNLHRNAVGYRINKIFSLLHVDSDNPDDLLLLQLACRARELG